MKLFSSIFIYSKVESDAKVAEKKSKGKHATAVDGNVTDLECKSRASFEHLVNLCWMGENELVAVGVNPVTLVEQLPSSLKDKRFGVS